MGQLDLSVLILSYNTKDITNRCLEKLKKAKKYCEARLKNKVAVIVLDNASSDESLHMIKQDHPWVKLIVSNENTGFSKGNNLLMKQAKTPFILLLNSDVYLEEDSLYKSLAYFRVNKNCDLLGVRLNFMTGKIQPSAGNLPNPLNLISWILGLNFLPFIPRFHPRKRSFFSKAHRVGWVMGAFFMLKKEIFEKTEGFDENLFMHMEEIEWCKRIDKAGYKIWYVPQIQVVHLHGASSRFDLSSSFLNELKGVKYYLNKHYASYYQVVKLFLVLGLVLRIIAFSFLRNSSRAKVYMEGLSVV